jgi:ankyrin repeat protein/mono/diheme cytochrome c family protein
MMFRRIARVAGALAVAGAGWYLLNSNNPARAQNRIDFAREVLPIFQESCVGCHGPEQQMAGLRLDRRSAVSGTRIRPGSSATSRVYLRISSSDFGQQMPPTGVLSAEAINTIKTWIDEGAVWPDALAGEAAVPPAVDAGASAIASALRTDDQRAFSVALANYPDAINRLAAGGATPLMFASLYGNAAAVRKLLTSGADPNVATDRGTTALMWAVGHEPVTRLLLDAGARTDAATAQNARPVAIASMRVGAEPVVKLLLSRGPTAPDGGANALLSARLSGAVTLATAAGDERVFRLLIANGFDPQTATWPALVNAVQTNCLTCVDTLLSAVRPAELNAALVALAGLPYPTVIQRLLDRGADPNARVMSMRRDLRGRTPLMVAASSDYLPTVTVKMLLERGADPNAAGVDGDTPLDLARRNGPTPVVEMLIAAGARPGKGFLRPALTPRPATSARAAVERALPLLQRADVTFIQKTGCVACHHNVYAAMTLAAARARGIAVDETAAREQVKVVAATLEGRREAALVGTEINDTAGNILMALAAANHPPDLATDAMAYFLRMRQQADGRWRPLVIDHRPPINSGDVEVTAVAIRALRAYAPKPHRALYERATERGIAWLRGVTPRTTDERAFQLLGLAWGGLKQEDVKLHAAAKQLLGEQRADGGWSQLPTLDSDAFATGQTLIALREAGAIAVTDAAYQQAVRFLLGSQLEDGSWYVQSRALAFQPYFESGFPHGHDQWVSNAATNWAAMALAAAVQP